MLYIQITLIIIAHFHFFYKSLTKKSRLQFAQIFKKLLTNSEYGGIIYASDKVSVTFFV